MAMGPVPDLSPTKEKDWLAAQQRAIELVAQFAQGGQAQAQAFAVQDGEGMKEREGDELDPQQRHHRHRMMMGAVGQVPVLGQFPKGVVLDLPPQMTPIPNAAPS
jgi:hypothetical protein